SFHHPPHPQIYTLSLTRRSSDLEESRTVTWTGAIRWPARALSGCAVKANAAAPKALGGGGGPADWSSLSSRHAAAMTVASARRRSILMALASHRKRRTAPANSSPALIGDVDHASGAVPCRKA